MTWDWRARAAAVEEARRATAVAWRARREANGVALHQSAADAFHRAIKEAWPPGFFAALHRLRDACASADDVEQVLEFLEADPMFFRSGYVEGKALKWITRGPCTPAQMARLRRLAIAAVDEPRRPSFRKFCSLARRVGGDELHQALARRLASKDREVRTRAEKMRDAALQPDPLRGGRADPQAMLRGLESIRLRNKVTLWRLCELFSRAPMTPAEIARLAAVLLPVLYTQERGFERRWFDSPARIAFVAALGHLAPTDARAAQILQSIAAMPSPEQEST